MTKININEPTPSGRQALILKELGMSWAEVGRLLGISRQSAQQAASPRARRLAQKKYQDKKRGKRG